MWIFVVFYIQVKVKQYIQALVGNKIFGLCLAVYSSVVKVHVRT